MTKQVSLGLLAHVDAGKTTLAERMLYESGSIRKPGRVDHQDAFLDTYALEKSRGITIFSKQAVCTIGDLDVTLVDTPGHVDFSAEAERTLSVLDYAILIISGADGVQGHTRTLFHLLSRYQIPTFLFFNKMDQPGTDRKRLLEEVREKLDENCVAFDEGEEALFENAATCREEALEEYVRTGRLSDAVLCDMIRKRQIFPCYFGSALLGTGVKEFMSGLSTYIGAAPDPYQGKEDAPFGAVVYKISRDPAGERLTHMKVVSGTLRPREAIPTGAGEEKINQIRRYHGEKQEVLSLASPGMLIAVTGPAHTACGQAIGEAGTIQGPLLEPVLNYQVLLPAGTDVHQMLRQLFQLEEEDPMLRVLWNEETGEIHVQLMGEIQTQILQSLVQDRFGVEVDFGPGQIVYKETIKNTVEGVGHFEPLRHYAEVHLILAPGERGSGMTYRSDCPAGMLDESTRRLILTQLKQQPQRGVLLGAEVTDMVVTLAAGRAHEKHTEGGDFLEAASRAMRQGLMQAESELLEPYYAFCLEVPSALAGRALSDIHQMAGTYDPPQTEGEFTRITGEAPVETMREYPLTLAAYTKGRGRISLSISGYRTCHNAEEVIRAAGYDPEKDMAHPAGSIFCAHGAGYAVPWQEVPSHMHVPRQLKDAPGEERAPQVRPAPAAKGTSRQEEEELEEIFIRTYGKTRDRRPAASKTVSAGEDNQKKPEEKEKEYLLVDGYNVIFAWEDLNELAQTDIGAARDQLKDILCNYQGYVQCTVILVFDAYKVEGGTMEVEKYHNIYVVYTKEAEIADTYIEKVVHEIGHKYHVTVVTSDGLEQVITRGQGSALISSREFEKEVEEVRRRIREEMDAKKDPKKNYLFDQMDEDLAREMEDVRLGRKDGKSLKNSEKEN